MRFLQFYTVKNNIDLKWWIFFRSSLYTPWMKLPVGVSYLTG